MFCDSGGMVKVRIVIVGFVIVRIVTVGDNDSGGKVIVSTVIVGEW